MIKKLKDKKEYFLLMLTMACISFMLTTKSLALGPEIGDGDNMSIEDTLEGWWDNLIYIINFFISILIVIIGISIVGKWIAYANANNDNESYEAKDGLRRGFIGIGVLGIGIVYIVVTLVTWGQSIGK